MKRHHWEHMALAANVSIISLAIQQAGPSTTTTIIREDTKFSYEERIGKNGTDEEERLSAKANMIGTAGLWLAIHG